MLLLENSKLLIDIGLMRLLLYWRKLSLYLILNSGQLRFMALGLLLEDCLYPLCNVGIVLSDYLPAFIADPRVLRLGLLLLPLQLQDLLVPLLQLSLIGVLPA